MNNKESTILEKAAREGLYLDEAHRVLHELRARIIDYVGDLIYVKDRDGVYLACNTASEKLFGLKESEQIGKTDFDFFDRDFADAIQEKDRHIFDTGIEQRFEEWVTFPDGKKVLLDTLKAPFYGPNGAIAGLVGISRDITERKRAEAKIEKLNTELAARAAELESFSYTVAHDLRKPLTIISGFCQLIREHSGDKLDEECKKDLQEVCDSTSHMSQLIETLLDFSRLIHTEPQRETVDLSAMAQTVTAGLKQADPARRATFRIADGITVNGDASLLRVVLENILDNAWKYTSMRGEAVIEFGMTEIDMQPVWFVRDNGTGFDMAHADKLFIPFQRLHKQDAEGHGIGLATVERIIKRHGGKVWADGEPDNGATFYFTL